MRLVRKIGQAMTAQRKDSATNGRRHMRYPLRVYVAYRWQDSQGQARRGHGWTQNVSEGGLLIRTEDCPKVGELVDVTLRVPSVRIAPGESSARMEMTGRVVRLLPAGEIAGKHGGFAVSQRFVPVVGENSQLSWQLWEVRDLRAN